MTSLALTAAGAAAVVTLASGATGGAHARTDAARATTCVDVTVAQQQVTVVCLPTP